MSTTEHEHQLAVLREAHAERDRLAEALRATIRAIDLDGALTDAERESAEIDAVTMAHAALRGDA
jgi:hypothetical protein